MALHLPSNVGSSFYHNSLVVLDGSNCGVDEAELARISAATITSATSRPNDEIGKCAVNLFDR